jgi:D-methionine transport system ATP-binding protein
MMTRRFVQAVIPDKIPDSILETMRHETRNYKLIRIRFLGSNTRENTLYHINMTYEIQTNILFASVNELQKTILGIFVVQFIGTASEIGAATGYLDEHHIQWEEVII